jgi:hypothetical protein
MRGKAALLATAATAVTFIGPVGTAHADFGDTIYGGCGFVTIGSPILPAGQNDGVIYVDALTTEQSTLPSDATLSCWITVNGVEQTATKLTAIDPPHTGIESGAKQINFTAADTDVVAECQQVTYADGSTWTAPDGSVGTDCRTENAGTDNTLGCKALVLLGLRVHGQIFGGLITINPDGDLYLGEPVGPGSIWIYDCPSFGNGTGSPLIPSASSPVFLRMLLPTGIDAGV